MHQYGARDVERLLHLPRSTIRSLVNAGFVSPARGPRKSYLFSFQDLIVLRTAQALAAAKGPSRRITKSLRELRRHLPDAMPLSGLAIAAVGDRVVVSEGASRCCSTTSAFCWKTWAAGARRWKRTKGRCTAIRASPIATTISRSCARRSASRGTPSGTWRSIEGWSSREDECVQILKPILAGA